MRGKMPNKNTLKKVYKQKNGKYELEMYIKALKNIIISFNKKNDKKQLQIVQEVLSEGRKK